MGAIPYKKTGTTDSAWDGPGMVAKCDSAAAPLRAMHAWVDSSGNPDAKSSYKFPHHECNGGNVGDANVKACISGIGVLNGGMGGAHIPEGDRQGVYNHLAHHLRDAGEEPPELKSLRSTGQMERRYVPLSELRVQGDGSEARLVGHAAVFNKLSEPISSFFGGGFREKIQPGAFSKTIREADVRALWNHDPNYVLGRNRANTLTLSEDNIGLAVDISPPDTQWARDLMTSVRRGDVNQMSFGFECVKDSWQINNSTETGDTEGNLDERTLIEVRLFDVSPVTYPAYPQTDVSARSVLATAGLDFDALSLLIVRQQRGLTPTAGDRDLIQASIAVLRSYLPGEPVQPDHSRGEQPHEPAQPGHSLETLRRRLDLLARVS